MDIPLDSDLVTALDLRDWVTHMRTVNRLAPATVNKRIAALKAIHIQDQTVIGSMGM